MSTDHSSVEAGGEVAATEEDKINTGALGTLVAVGMFAMLSITAAVTALVRHDIEAEEAVKDADSNQVVVELKAKQHDALTGPAKYVDRNKGVVSLPIDVAKGLVVAELQRDPSSATPPAPQKAEASAESASAAGGAPGAGGASAASSGGAPAAAGGAPAVEGKGTPTKPEQGREVKKPTPADSAKPSAVPTPTPTAATPGAQAPGPINK
ncbi:MAG TPA: hypothetical protein VER11_31495 [Polyangiaceae bacterium]|nr:hypothetical protein [Polyangiaceae bacterium]